MLANVELSWLAPSKLRRTVIVGSRKMLVYDDTSSEPIRIFDHGVVYEDPESFGAYQLSYRTGDILSPRVDTAEPLGVEMQAFADAIRAGAGAGRARRARPRRRADRRGGRGVAARRRPPDRASPTR